MNGYFKLAVTDQYAPGFIPVLHPTSKKEIAIRLEPSLEPLSVLREEFPEIKLPIAANKPLSSSDSFEFADSQARASRTDISKPAPQSAVMDKVAQAGSDLDVPLRPSIARGLRKNPTKRPLSFSSVASGLSASNDSTLSSSAKQAFFPSTPTKAPSSSYKANISDNTSSPSHAAVSPSALRLPSSTLSSPKVGSPRSPLSILAAASAVEDAVLVIEQVSSEIDSVMTELQNQVNYLINFRFIF